MYKCQIISLSRDMVGNNCKVKAEIIKEKEHFLEVVSTIILLVENGASMNDLEIEAYILAVYELSLEV